MFLLSTFDFHTLIKMVAYYEAIWHLELVLDARSLPFSNKSYFFVSKHMGAIES